jgi:MFS family permease
LSATFGALSSRDFRLFACGQAISVTGTWMQKLAQAWLVLLLTHSSFAVGLTVAVQQLPTLFLTPFGGYLADRFERRHILIITAVCGALPALALGALMRAHLIQVWMVLAAALFQGLTDAVEKPTRLTLANDIVASDHLTNAVMLNNIIQDSGKLAGPAIGGIIIATAGVSAAFFANAVSYLPVIVGLALMHPAVPAERATTSRGNLRGTLRYVAGRRDLAIALSLTAVLGIFAYNFSVLVPVFFRDVFAADARATGLGLTCMGLGGVVGGVLVAGRMKISLQRVVLTAAVFGIALTMLALAPTIWLGYAGIFLVGAASTTFLSVSGAQIQLGADPAMRGRVTGLYVLALAGSSPIGGPMQGAIAEWASARVAFGVAAAATFVTCAVVIRLIWPGRVTPVTPVTPVAPVSPAAPVTTLASVAAIGELGAEGG